MDEIISGHSRVNIRGHATSCTNVTNILPVAKNAMMVIVKSNDTHLKKWQKLLDA